jgi:hypothetical protein
VSEDLVRERVALANERKSRTKSSWAPEIINSRGKESWEPVVGNSREAAAGRDG